MFSGFPLFPEQASSLAPAVDGLYFFLVAITTFFSLGIAAALAIFATRYKRRHADERPPEIEGSLALELAWTIIPFAICMVVFVWGAVVFFAQNRPPDDSMEINVVGKRWMWKLQHMTGQREINELHVPVGRPVKLNLTSEDVIHSFFVPAFRMKKDAVPGRYSVAWFRATKAGTYHLFCAEYCGTEHSRMIGRIVVMEPDDYQTWLQGGPAPVSPVAAGEKLFTQLNCVTCHVAGSQGRGPSLAGVAGSKVRLVGGDVVAADESYLRESIVNPAAKIVEGYQPIMPTYQGQVSEDMLLQLIAYIQSLKEPQGTSGGSASGGQP
jgi:cytochrome c oxidase subunit II